jgi:hypothetical protein
MKHAMTINSCPFCGKNIFTSKEFDFRSSIQKILIKNNIDHDEQISLIVDDISNYFRQIFHDEIAESADVISTSVAHESSPGPAAAARAKAAAIAEARRAGTAPKVQPALAPPRPSEAEDEDDGIPVDAPSRRLAPDPKRYERQNVAAQKGSNDKVGAAMRLWEETQKIDDDEERPGAFRRADEAEEDVDISDVFIMEKDSEQDEKVQRLRQAAANAKVGRPGSGPVGTAGTRPSFKSKPVS